MTDMEQFLRSHGETALYIVFFGMLLSLGLMETRRQISARPLERRQRWPANWFLTAINIVLLGAIPITALTVADFVRDQGIGLFNTIAVPTWLGIVGGILARSFGAWLVHLAMHKVPVLWRVHKVHHCDREMDISTTVRFHPLEFAIQVPITLGIVVLFGIPPMAILVFELLDAAIAVFSHANIRLAPRLERVMGWFIITPSMHRVHHSSYQPETDSNYGATLSVWDRLFGTLVQREPDALSTMRIGLDDIDTRDSQRIAALLTIPFRARTMPTIPRSGDNRRAASPKV